VNKEVGRGKVERGDGKGEGSMEWTGGKRRAGKWQGGRKIGGKIYDYTPSSTVNKELQYAFLKR